MRNATIDVAARRVAAERYRHFAAGIITNVELEDSLPSSSEQGLRDVFLHGVWSLYDDTREYKLTGQDRLTPERREHIARIILFLHGELPYGGRVAPGGDFWCSRLFLC